MPAPFDIAWGKTANAEGGYSNDPADPGGETNHGITVGVARAQGYAGAMIDLTAEQARDIAKKAYWDVLKLDSVAFLSVPIALELFDTSLNMGQSTAVLFLQRGLRGLNRNGTDYPDILADGRMGNETIGALAHFLTIRGTQGERVMVALLNAQQACEYLRQVEVEPAKERFLYGWLANRVLQATA